MKLIVSFTSAHPSDNCLEVIPTSEDKEMQIEFRNIQFKDSFKLINSPLKTIVAQTLGNDLDQVVCSWRILRETRNRQFFDPPRS